MIAGRYRVLQELGRGGMGVVYMVEHVNTGQTQALKVLLSHVGAKADLVARFQREARTPAQIRSEHVVKVTDADVAPELGGAPFLVMELLEGVDLDHRLTERGALPPGDLIAIFSPIAEVLDRAHALGIVHRDLKPENIFLHHQHDGTVVVKLLDFGIAKLLDSASGADGRLTKTGAMLGTPVYMSPEQASGDIAGIGPASDIWAIGQLAFRCLSGAEYWAGSNTSEVVAQILTAPLVPPSSLTPQLPTEFDNWFIRSCNRDPGARWPTVTAQVEALAAAFGIQIDRPVYPSLSEIPTTAIQKTAAATNGTEVQPATAVPAMAGSTEAMSVEGTAPPLPGISPKPPSTVRRALLIAIGVLLLIGATVVTVLALTADSETTAAKRSKSTASSVVTATDNSSSRGKPHMKVTLNLGAPDHYDDQQLLRAIKPYMPDVRTCYERELVKQPELRGTMVMSLLVDLAGNVSTATCMTTEERGGVPKALCPCVRTKASAWRFPRPKGRVPLVGFSFRFLFSHVNQKR